MYSLIPINEHAAAIAHIITEPESFSIEFGKIYEWLLAAAAIHSININIIQYQRGFGYCEAADEYDISKEKLTEKFLYKLSIFSLTWSALECCIDVINPYNYKKNRKNKIKSACLYIDKNFTKSTTLPLLEKEILNFRRSAETCLGYETVLERFKKCQSRHGQGIYVIYELRNSFAHGDLSFPTPDENNQPVSNHHLMLEHATRIILMQIQMLILAYTRYSSEEVNYDWGIFSSEPEPLWLALRRCHLKPDNPNQMNLFENPE